ncbi:MAG: V-type ATPase 116kDa subunit family protein [Ilumatobacter sp.]|uniref:V-type ATP synthase subunit I n=1 Tax=Ilumatobacter sp. TaxID=1967498 RepID=UPI00262C074C|nr:V-type ATPase 116kDa subunit family protein [Ilumatobacter sp.]MDJ0768322.1 V-type ATPase 116kDa subunit family protein [Ilumatobacter sp.]
MAKVHVIGHRRQLDDVLTFLHQRQALHLIDVTDDADVRLPPLRADQDQVREIEELRYLKARIDAVLGLVPQPPPPDRGPDATGADDLDVLRAQLEEVGPRLEELVRRRDDLTNELDVLPRYLSSLRGLMPLVPEMTDFTGYDTTALLVDSRSAEVLGELNVSLAGILGANFEVISDHVGPDTIGAVLVFPKGRAAEIRSLLGREQLTQVRLPVRFRGMPFREAISAMERRLTELPGEIEVTDAEIDEVVRPLGYWSACRAHLVDRLDQLDAVAHLGATLHTFVISGWVPESELASLPDDLVREIGPEVVVEQPPVAETDQPPVLMRNPAPARPFQFLVGLLGLPKYGTIDPTRLMALFLPFFFGIMLGDVAYGVLLLVLSYLGHRAVRDRSAVGRDLTIVLMMSAGWATLWGIVYGEFFGDLGHRLWGWEPIWINREEAIEPLLVFALAIGAAHVVLGLVLGGVQAIRARNRHVLSERVAMLVSLIGLFLIVGVAADALPSGVVPPAAAAVAVGLAVLIALGGPMGALLGPLELIGTVGNVLSYLRLAAIGLASVYLARVANELGAAAPLAFGIIVAALFHALNLALGAFSPTIQSLRLHYVEFFDKFHETGGEAFRPFGADDAASDRNVR